MRQHQLQRLPFRRLKFWLLQVGLAGNFGFPSKELRGVQKLVIQHQVAFLEAWHGHLGANG